MEKKGNLVFRTALFVLMFGFLLSIFTSALLPYNESTLWAARFKSFYDEPRDSIDVLYLGSSHVYSGIIPLEIWKEYGFTGFIRANPFQSPLLSYYYLVEALKYQKPKVVVLEASYIYREIDIDGKEGILRRGVDPMVFSEIKLGLINEIVSLSEQQTVISFLLPIFRYHARWSELTWNDLFTRRSEVIDVYKGYSEISLDSEPQMYLHYQETHLDEVREFDETSLGFYEKIIELCQQNDIQVVLLTMPGLQWNQAMHDGIQQFANRHHVEYIDYGLSEHQQAIGLDQNKDFLDGSHLNTLGAQKLSGVLGAFLQKTYHLGNQQETITWHLWNDDLKQYEHDLASAFSANIR